MYILLIIAVFTVRLGSLDRSHTNIVEMCDAIMRAHTQCRVNIAYGLILLLLLLFIFDNNNNIYSINIIYLYFYVAFTCGVFTLHLFYFLSSERGVNEAV